MRKTLAVVLFMLPLVATALAQGPTCTVNSDTVTPDCSGSTWLSGVTCVHKTISCPTTSDGVSFADIGITFGYKNPTGTANGTIVFFSDGGGTTTDDNVGTSKLYAASYVGSGYQIVQTAWDSDWEDTGTTTKNIAYAAGRPAAFLQWANTNLYGPVHTSNPQAGMCAQGASAGGAAIAYALAWYNAGSGTGSNQNFLDKAELLSAPPLADIEKGCVVIGGLGSPEATVCPTGQLGCNSYNSPSSWTQSLSYTDGAPSVRTWSGLNSCVNGSPTSDADNDTWKDMSIVDGDIATFSYPKTQITAWVCSSVEGTIEGEGGGTMNNSSPQGQLFFQQFTSSSQTAGLLINGVTICETDEEVGGGVPPSNYSGSGMAAIEYDMTTDTNNLCKARH